MLLCSTLGMVMMTSSRDLLAVFIALELLSIPAYMLAAWRKRDGRSNEAGVKYYLLGVFASAVLLYGMSLLYGTAGSTKLVDIGVSHRVRQADRPAGDRHRLRDLGVRLQGVGGAVPHLGAGHVRGGADAGDRVLVGVVEGGRFRGADPRDLRGVPHRRRVYGPLVWVLAALTMTIGNVLALRQTNIVRMLAYSSVSQGGFILMPLAFVNSGEAAGPAMKAVVVYLLVYAVTNLGVFAVVIAVARKTHSGEISSYGGLFSYAPGLAVLMTIFLASLAGVPPLGGWIAKFNVFRAVLSRDRVGLCDGRDRGGQHGHRRGVLPAGDARDVDERAARRRRHAGRHAAAGDGGAGDHRASARWSSACCRAS